MKIITEGELTSITRALPFKEFTGAAGIASRARNRDNKKGVKDRNKH